MTMMHRPLLVLPLLALAVCGGRSEPPGGEPEPPPALDHTETTMSTQSSSSDDASGRPKGLTLRLSEGQAQLDAEVGTRVAEAEKLDPGAIRRVLDRLPPLDAKQEEQSSFALREGSAPPPRTGATVQQPFPPAETAEAPPVGAPGPLEVLRRAPEGPVELAPQLSVTFSQPMVALKSHEELAKQGVPVTLTPEPPGHWRWVGTKTLLFEPDGRFPMATRFTAEIPKGTRSATGGTLADAVRWTFETPPPMLLQSYPQGGTQRRDTLVFMRFDQRVDPAAILSATTMKSGSKATPARLATPDEIAADESVRRLVDEAEPGRTVVLRPAVALPAASKVVVAVGKGAPSLEGPLVTAEAQSFELETYGPLVVKGSRCGWDECTPNTPWEIEFSNPLDATAFDPSLVTVEPALPGMKAHIYGNMLQILGYAAGRTKYGVKLDPAIRDAFGQELGRRMTLSIHVGPAPEALWSAGGPFVVVDPAGKPTYSIYSVNVGTVDVRLYAVGPEDWDAYAEAVRDVHRKGTEPPGRRVLSKAIDIASHPDELQETRIDLTPALQGGLGNVVVVVEQRRGLMDKLRNRSRTTIMAWAQVTQMGLDAVTDGEELVALVTRLSDGAPLEGVDVSVLPEGGRAVTGAGGIASVALTNGKGTLLVARSGGDQALLPRTLSMWDQSAGWTLRSAKDSLRWYVFDDRRMYRPGEEVHVKGWIRRAGTGRGADISAIGDAAGAVSYRVVGPQGNDVAIGTVELDPLGGFTFVVPLPETMNLGRARIVLSADAKPGELQGLERTHWFDVQEFRRPEFEVGASAGEGPHFAGGSADVSVKATYYAGGGLPNAEVQWFVTSSPGHFTPPGRSGFVFGTWVPWWVRHFGGAPAQASGSYSGRTDATGEHHLRIAFEGKVDGPSVVQANATVTDVNRQAWSSRASVLVHPSRLYVGLHSDRTFVQRGAPLEVDAIVADLDGALAHDVAIAVRAVRLDWTQDAGTWKQEETDEQTCEVRSGADPVRCTFETKQGGTYKVEARVHDPEGRPNRSELTLWVSGGAAPPPRGLEQEKVDLIPDREEYQPGETAELLVQSPFAPAHGLLTVQRAGIVRKEPVELTSPSTTLRIPIEEPASPGVTVQVDLVGAAPRLDADGKPDDQLPKRPAFASSSITLRVPPRAQTLSLDVAPRDEALEPGGRTEVVVAVHDAAGKPVAGAQVAVVVVDEAILALSGYDLADPAALFHGGWGAETSTRHSRSSVLLAGLEDLAEQVRPPEDSLKTGNGGPRRNGHAKWAQSPPTTQASLMPPPAPRPGGGGGAPEPIAVRADFDALATFAPALPTGADGRARVDVKLPDNLTRYRVMAVAAAGARQFGKGESAITARLPLMVRPSAPRFLNFGDRFQLPVVLQNQTDAPMTVDVVVRAANAELPGGQGRRLSVPANDRVEVLFPAATARAGQARFQVGAVTGTFADAAEVKLPVWTPATTEAFATYGEIDDGAVEQPLSAPDDVVEQFGGLEVTTSATALQALTDAVLYLASYPFECSEQLSSRVLAVAALRDVLSAFDAEGLPSPDELVAAVARDVERLQALQNHDGGFGFWRRGDDSWPWVSIHATHALARARAKGFEVPDEMIRQGEVYLRAIGGHIPSWYGTDARRTLEAYALYVRALLGDADSKAARRLISDAGLQGLPLESVGFLLSVLAKDPGTTRDVADIVRHLNNRATETASAAHFTTSYGDSAYVLLSSDRRADAVILSGLIEAKPDSDLIPKVVRGLLAHRKRGRWGNTQENAFVLLALDRYFAKFEANTPDFVAKVWLGDGLAGSHAFKGRTTERAAIEIPMSFLVETRGEQRLVVGKDGPGRMYYRLGMRYAPASLKLDPADHGFTVERAYEAVDAPEDVTRDESGAWHVRAGAKVRVRVTMVAPTRRYHVALTDPLPAGLEAMNPALAVTGAIPQDPTEQQSRGGYWWWHRTWYEHQNLRDERVEAFTSLLWEGVHTYTYVARATTPGSFVVPPPKAEEMYAPETFGRGGTDRLVVE